MVVGYGFGDPGECVPAEAAAGFEDRHHHRERFAARTRFRAEAQFAEDHRPPERTFGGVVRRGNAGGVGEHEQTVAMVAQSAAGFGRAAIIASPCLIKKGHVAGIRPHIRRNSGRAGFLRWTRHSARGQFTRLLQAKVVAGITPLDPSGRSPRALKRGANNRRA